MVEINNWLDIFLTGLKNLFVGLQGSYARKEAYETSDIDVVVILDELHVSDICAYREFLDTLSHRELICGFLSGKNELLSWEPSDLFQFYFDTRPIIGSLDMLLPLFDDTVVDRAIKIGACNIYHGCVHNMVHEKSNEILRNLYKSASFVLQAICYKQTGKYISGLKDLLNTVSDDDRVIVETFINLKNGFEISFDLMSEILFKWSGKWIREV